VIVEVNGEAHELQGGARVTAAVELAGGAPAAGVAVAVDGEVVPRSEWETTPLREGQSVEIVAAVQGG
jgi:sulfur carrier protein